MKVETLGAYTLYSLDLAVNEKITQLKENYHNVIDLKYYEYQHHIYCTIIYEE